LFYILICLTGTLVQAIVLKDTKKNAKKGVMMPLKSVKMVKEGLGKVGGTSNRTSAGTIIRTSTVP
jgi:hypothetical protein